MGKKIIGTTVGTPISPTKIEEKINPVKTVNNSSPDVNGNVSVSVPTDTSRAPAHTYGTTDIEAGSASTEPNGTLHLVIE